MKSSLIKFLKPHKVGDELLYSFIKDEDSFVLVYKIFNRPLSIDDSLNTLKEFCVVSCIGGLLYYFYFETRTAAFSFAIVDAAKYLN